MGQEMITFSAPQGPDPTLSQRALNIVIYIVFCSYQEQNSAICDAFSSSSHKIEPKHWYLRCFRNNQKRKCSQNTAICDTLATQHVRNAVFYSIFGTLSQKHPPANFLYKMVGHVPHIKQFFIENFWCFFGCCNLYSTILLFWTCAPAFYREHLCS